MTSKKDLEGMLEVGETCSRFGLKGRAAELFASVADYAGGRSMTGLAGMANTHLHKLLDEAFGGIKTGAYREEEMAQMLFEEAKYGEAEAFRLLGENKPRMALPRFCSARGQYVLLLKEGGLAPQQLDETKKRLATVEYYVELLEEGLPLYH